MTPNYETTTPGPPKKKGMPVWGIVMVVGCLIVPIIVALILASILVPVFAQSRERARGIVCLSHAKQMGMAALLYAKDHDEVLPPEKSAWIDQLEPYTKSDSSIEVTAPTKRPTVYQCPSVTSGPGYAMSSKVAGAKLIKLKEPYTVRLIFDSDVPGRNAFAAPEAVAYRHADQRGSIVFADGHAKSLRR